MQTSSLFLAVALFPGVALAQFTQNPGLSPTQERLLNPIPLPPPAPTPSPAVPMIVPPTAVVSTPPPLTSFPAGSGAATVNPADKRERPQTQSAPKSTAPKGPNWQTVTLPPAPNFTRGQSAASADSADAAKASIESDGYRRVSGLVRGTDGVWRGRAMRGATEVAVSVDALGNVTAD